ncbi:LAMI_0H13850g1_1 [Lachancea mirantina]|uniref:LAMI_0H13850g1_1 n=1 Tax=Lachancea mirantina TaxID=1230905 RepID=A0A1G4KI45_9SACH|nr:LAMI_0H13850g1_1 [Lachancea mirantina]
MTSKRSDKAVSLKGDEAENLIEEYLTEQYRPFALNDIIQNLHNKVSRTNAQRALENLTNDNRIICKPFGKVMIYVCNERKVAEPADTDPVSVEMVMQMREELIELEKDRIDVNTEFQNSVKQPTNEDLISMIEARNCEIRTLQQQLVDIESHWNPENERIIMKVQDYEKSIAKETSARKRIFGNARSLVKEALNVKNLDEFLEDIGVEVIH